MLKVNFFKCGVLYLLAIHSCQKIIGYMNHFYMLIFTWSKAFWATFDAYNLCLQTYKKTLSSYLLSFSSIVFKKYIPLKFCIHSLSPHLKHIRVIGVELFWCYVCVEVDLESAFFTFLQMINERIWSSGGVVLTGEIRRNVKKTSFSYTFSAINSTWNE